VAYCIWREQHSTMLLTYLCKSIGVCVCMYVLCMYVCMYVCVHKYVGMKVCMYECKYSKHCTTGCFKRITSCPNASFELVKMATVKLRGYVGSPVKMHRRFRFCTIFSTFGKF
jgi:hypothetical protein